MLKNSFCGFLRKPRRNFRNLIFIKPQRVELQLNATQHFLWYIQKQGSIEGYEWRGSFQVYSPYLTNQIQFSWIWLHPPLLLLPTLLCLLQCFIQLHLKYESYVTWASVHKKKFILTITTGMIMPNTNSIQCLTVDLW